MRQKSKQIEDFTCLISLSIVSPAFEDKIVQTMDRLDEIGIDSFTLLVTPLFEMKGSNNFEKHDVFSKYLISMGQELSLYGFSHLTKSGDSAEFKGLNVEQIKSKLQRGVSSFRSAFGFHPTGFVPPQWIAPSSIQKAMDSMKFKYYVVDNQIHSFDGNKVFTTTDHFISIGDGKLDIMDSLIELEIGGAMQIAIHPNDYGSDSIFALITDMRDRLGYKFLSYRDYLNTNLN